MARRARAASSRALHAPLDRRFRGAQGDGGRCLHALQAAPPTVALRRTAGRDDRRRIDGDARLRNRSLARTPRRSRYLGVAPGVSISRQARDRYAAPDACRVRDRGNETSLLGLSEEPGARVKRGHRATPRGMSSDRVVSRTTDSTVSTTANSSPTVLGTAMTTLQRPATPPQL